MFSKTTCGKIHPCTCQLSQDCQFYIVGLGFFNFESVGLHWKVWIPGFGLLGLGFVSASFIILQIFKWLIFFRKLTFDILIRWAWTFELSIFWRIELSKCVRCTFGIPAPLNVWIVQFLESCLWKSQFSYFSIF